MRKCRILIVFLALLIAAGALLGADAVTLFEGTGTAEDPYLIQSVPDLVALSLIVNRGTSFSGLYFLQTCDLDLTGVRMAPIGRIDSETGFAGFYDGGGHLVRGFTMRHTDGAALFGLLSGTVSNLGLENCDITADYRASALVFKGVEKKGRLVNCYATGSVRAIEAGGLTYDFRYCDISSSWFSGDLEGELTGGLFVGGKPSKLDVAYADSSSGFGAVRASEPGYMTSAAFVDELNESGKRFLNGTRTSVYPHRWQLTDGRAVLTENKIDRAEAFMGMLPTTVRTYVNEVFVGLTALVFLVGAAIVVGSKAAGSKKGDFTILGTAWLIGAVVFFLEGQFGDVLFMRSKEWVWEEGWLALEGLVVASFVTYRIRRKDMQGGRLEDGVNTGRLFLAMLAVCLVFTGIALILWGRRSLGSLFYPERKLCMESFANQLIANRTKQPIGFSNYGPLGWALVRILTFAIPGDMFRLHDATELIAAMGRTKLVMALLWAGGTGLFAYGVYQAVKGIKRSRKETVMLTVLLTASAPVLASLGDCNMSLYGAAFVLLSINQGRLKRPLLLAIAVGFHPLCALFGLLLISEKRFGQFLVWALCSGLGLTLPVVIRFGKDGLAAYAGAYFSRCIGGHVMVLDSLTRSHTVSFSGSLNTLMELITNNPVTPVIPLCDKLGFAICALLLCAALVSRGWKRVLCISLLVCGLSRGDTPVVIAFMSVALVYFLKEGDDSGAVDRIVYLIVFLAMFANFPVGNVNKAVGLQLWRLEDMGHLTLGTLIKEVALLTAALYTIVSCGRGLILPGKTNRNVRQDQVAI